MILHKDTVMGLGDGGAHVGTICDASFITSLLTHWGRDRTRGEGIICRLDQVPVVRHCPRSGLTDLGRLRRVCGGINIIDFDKLTVRLPEIVEDLPAGGARLQQRADGYQMTIEGRADVY